MRILFLDDDPKRVKLFCQETIGNIVDIARTVQEAISFLKKNEYDLTSLDHDLGGKTYTPSDENSGYEVARFISQMQKPPERNIIHSLYKEGAEKMYYVIRNTDSLIVPFNSEFYWESIELYKSYLL